MDHSLAPEMMEHLCKHGERFLRHQVEARSHRMLYLHQSYLQLASQWPVYYINTVKYNPILPDYERVAKATGQFNAYILLYHSYSCEEILEHL